MDVVQFGRWLADRRRDNGWSSQRALAVAAQAHPRISGLGVSEAFLARLEAGLLVHPFRGAARVRVVGLAWLLCGSARQVRDYVRLAELGSLSRAETAEIDSLLRSLSDAQPPRHVILPPPPARMVGREDTLAALTAALAQLRGGCCLITGMAGIGKTCLAIAAAHQLAAAHKEPVPYADGIIFVTCTGRHGKLGAYTILEDVLALQQPPDRSDPPRPLPSTEVQRTGVGGNAVDEGALGRIADHLRQALSGRRLLVVLDGIEPDLPLDRVVDALQPHSFSLAQAPSTPSDALPAPVVLITSRSLPRLSSHAHHIHLHPLSHADGARLIEHVLGTALDADNRQAALRLCAAVGGVAVAIEAAAALARSGVPLKLLADTAERNPLAIFGGDAPGATIAESLDALPAATRAHLAALTVLETESFGLGAAEALRPETPGGRLMTAGDLVRHSLIEPVQLSAEKAPYASDAGAVPVSNARFRLPPLVQAYATQQAQAMPPAIVASARRNLSAYADAYIEQHTWDTQALAQEEAVLRAGLRYAVEDGEHERTVRLVHGLLPLALRRDTCDDIGHLALAGIRAGKASADRPAIMLCLNLLGVIRLYQGDTLRARRAWTQCLQLAGDLRAPHASHSAAYLNLAQVADLAGDPDAAWHLGELGVLYSRRVGIAATAAGALSMQAERARRRGEHHVAHAYARESLDLAVASATVHPLSSQPACVVEAQLALAHTECDYAAASAYASQYLGLLDSYSRLFVTEALIDEAEYCLDANAKQDAMRLATRALAVAGDARATALARRARAVRRRADQPDRDWRGRAAGE